MTQWLGSLWNKLKNARVASDGCSLSGDGRNQGQWCASRSGGDWILTPDRELGSRIESRRYMDVKRASIGCALGSLERDGEHA